jgi:hypothetical protein
VSTALQVATDLVELASSTEGLIHQTTLKFGALLQTEARRNASQPRTQARPWLGQEVGPRALTGDLRRSINRRTTKLAHTSMVEIGTDAPQGRRLELGFVGVDAAGRHIDQRPYPYLRPALDKIRPAYEAAIAALSVPK